MPFQKRDKKIKPWREHTCAAPQPIERPARVLGEPSAALNLEDLRQMMRSFLTSFPWVPRREELEGKINTFSGALKDVDTGAIRRAMQTWLRTNSEPPSIAELLELALPLASNPCALPASPPLPPHVCVSPVLADSNARRMLAMIDAYAAAHVACSERSEALCPNCGALSPALPHRAMLRLMDLYPEETAGWVPKRKGYQLCPACRAKKSSGQ